MFAARFARSQAGKAIQRRAGASERGCFEGMGVLVTGLGSGGSDNETGGEHQLFEANPAGLGLQPARQGVPDITTSNHLAAAFDDSIHRGPMREPRIGMRSASP